MTVQQEVLKSETPAYVELFKLDLTSSNIPDLSGQKFYLTPMLNNNYTPISFGGQEYLPYPLEITGITQSTEGAPARPTLNIANISKYFGALSFQYNDIIGSTVEYIRTFEPYLGLETSISLPPMRFIIRKKLAHNKVGMSFELGFPQDKERSFMPKRQMLRKDFPGLGVNKNV